MCVYSLSAGSGKEMLHVGKLLVNEHDMLLIMFFTGIMADDLFTKDIQ